MVSPNVALVIGASGVTGAPLVEQLARSGWKVYGIARTAPEWLAGQPGEFDHVPVDLTDARSVGAALSRCSDIAHVFYCANHPVPATRVRMLANLLDAVETSAPAFANINLLQGLKYYGSYLDEFKTPAKESDPRVPGGTFYYPEEDLVAARQAGRKWTWTAVRPFAVCGYAARSPLNVATVLAVYGSMLRALGRPFGFPGSPACFGSLLQVVDAELLARSAIHVSTHARENQAFNVGNGDVFRWKHMWPVLARFFELEPEGPQPFTLAEFFREHRSLWEKMAARCSLRPFPIDQAPAWVQGDFSPPNSRLCCEYDVIADTVKIRLHGFAEAMDSEQMFLRMFANFRRNRIIP
jgi:nucleoside-diphosphate-sugar epimerase